MYLAWTFGSHKNFDNAYEGTRTIFFKSLFQNVHRYKYLPTECSQFKSFHPIFQTYFPLFRPSPYPRGDSKIWFYKKYFYLQFVEFTFAWRFFIRIPTKDISYILKIFIILKRGLPSFITLMASEVAHNFCKEENFTQFFVYLP